jgi:hypothetical protein
MKQPKFLSVEGLKDLAAMRFLHTMPIDAARKEFSRIYGELDESTLRKRRLRAIEHFKTLFGTNEEPAHGALYNANGERGEKCQKEPE